MLEHLCHALFIQRYKFQIKRSENDYQPEQLADGNFGKIKLQLLDTQIS